jgi:NAD-dependent DNA ligase
MKQDIKS